jgi:hypothetical protein
MDESGTSDVPGNTSHFVLVGVSLPIWHWRDADREISSILSKYGLENAEIHTAWMLRNFLEQSKIASFEKLSWDRRVAEVNRARTASLLDIQKRGKKKLYRQTKKNYEHTKQYIHLTHSERKQAVREIADCVGNWGFCRLFAECIDKVHFDKARTKRTIDEQAFEQIVSRFERYMSNVEEQDQKSYGLLVHDNNETVAREHTNFMRDIQRRGTLWTKVDRIIETPMFVDSKLTRMVQVADLCSYALRRYLENDESDLFSRVFPRADRYGNYVVGVRHYTDMKCACQICSTHRKS